MTPSSSRQGPFRKPKPDVFTVLLVLGLVAIITGCILLYLEVADYGTDAYSLAESVDRQPVGPASFYDSPFGLPGPWMSADRIMLCHV